MTDFVPDTLVSVQDAVVVLDATVVTMRAERVALADADGRVLAGVVTADRDYPPFDKSLMDGYAVRTADAGDRRCVGAVAAGGGAGVIGADVIKFGAIGAGECVAIMTGAPLPPGADGVVPVERTRREGDIIHIDGPVKPGDAIARRAVEMTAGRPVLPVGTRLGPAQLAVCAQVGAHTPDVFARPRVGVLSSGDEIVPYTATPVGAHIRDSNSPMLTALLNRYGCDIVPLGHVCDDPAALAEKFSTPGLDALFVTGGMSMGVYDYTPRVLRDLGYDLAITKLKIKPGKPFVFARRNCPVEQNGAMAAGVNPRENDVDLGTEAAIARVHTRGRTNAAPFIFGLPGNPVSAFVCTVRLASRLLLRMSGQPPEPEWVVATLRHDLSANGLREFYQPAVVDGGVADVPAWNGSADVFTLARANALLVRMAHDSALKAGDMVTLLRLP